ncbi:MAG: M20/M25/M40 family metallo-hydrolase [Dehalococcoidia bacterium]|nr:M20/M25/M40 family metallo-hydrolase [Dehalococcoidia bacterium]
MYKADAAIIPEPTNMDTLVAMRGSLSGTITVFGRVGHTETMQPHWSKGGTVDATPKAVKTIQTLGKLTEEWRIQTDWQHKFLDQDIITPIVLRGGEWRVMYPEKVGIEFISDFIPSTVNIKEEIEEKIMSVANTDPWMKQYPPKLEINPWHYGTEINENQPIARTVIEVAKELDSESKSVGWGTLTDAIHLVNYSKIPTISIGPDNQAAHMANEFVDIDQLISLTKILALFTLRWCGYS